MAAGYVRPGLGSKNRIILKNPGLDAHDQGFKGGLEAVSKRYRSSIEAVSAQYRSSPNVSLARAGNRPIHGTVLIRNQYY
jgi:hypothetical protein